MYATDPTLHTEMELRRELEEMACYRLQCGSPLCACVPTSSNSVDVSSIMIIGWGGMS